MNGLILSRLIELFTEARNDLATGSESKASAAINADLVYQEIGDRLRMPVRSCTKADHLRGLLDDIEKMARPPMLKPQVATVRRFLDSHGNGFRTTDYCIVPVVTGDDAAETQLFYLRARPLANPGGQRLRTDRLTQQRHVADHFDLLAGQFLECFYKLHRYPGNRYEAFDDTAFELYFDAQITEGKSVDAGLWVMFCIAFLRRKFPTEFGRIAAPRCGTVLTGEIDSFGKVRPVSDTISQKLTCAFDEFGPDLKIVVSDEEVLPEVAGRIHRKNLHRVGTAEDLLVAFLSDEAGDRGLEGARRKVFQFHRQTAFYEELLNSRLEGVPKSYFDEEGHVVMDHGVHARPLVWAGAIELSVASNFRGLSQIRPGIELSKDLVLLILDGSSVMDNHWEHDPSSSSRLASIIEVVAGLVNRDRNDLMIGFLSRRGSFEEVPLHLNRVGINQLIEATRKQEKLRVRGAFFRPIREGYLQNSQYAQARKRIYILSNSFIPDLWDLEDANVEYLEQLALSPGGPNRSLFDETGKFDERLLRACFQQQTASMPSLSVDFGECQPYRWSPHYGVLRSKGLNYTLSWSSDTALSWRVVVDFEWNVPPQIRVNGRLRLHEKDFEYKGLLQMRNGTFAGNAEEIEGMLSDPDILVWRNLCDPSYECPGCKEKAPHLYDPPKHGVLDEPLLGLLNTLPAGWVMLSQNSPKWKHFGTGCQVVPNELVVSIVNGELCSATAEGRTSSIPYVGNRSSMYELRNGENTYYFSRVVGRASDAPN